MRALRAIYNKTARQKLIEQQHPFTEVYTGIDRTRKRAVSESIIFQLHRLELEAGTPLSLCRDMFIFSYCTRGMAFVDIAVNGNQKCSDFCIKVTVFCKGKVFFYLINFSFIWLVVLL